MKKGKSKKLVAWLLAFAILMSPSTGFRVFADDDGGVDQGAVVSTTAEDSTADDVAAATNGQDSTDGSADQAADQDDIADQNDPAAGGEPQATVNAGEPAVTGEPVSGDEQTDSEGDQATEESTTEEEPAEPEVEDGGLINNLFIEEQSLQAPGDLNAIISFGEGEEQLENVKLILTGDDGQQSEIPLTQKVLHYYQFTKTYESQEAGTYRLTAFTYELDGHKKRIDLKNTGISAQFSVSNGEESDCAEETGISVTALTSDEISTDLTYEIENTIQEVAQEAVDDINEGAVSLGTSSTDKSYSRAGVSAELTAATDRAVTLGSYSASRAYVETPNSMVIVLDPGHGGSDPGTSNQSEGLIESQLNLKVANYCKAELEKYTGIKVYMTRTSDTYVSLEDRVKIAKNYGAHLFVSIHMNSATSKNAEGAEVYYPNANYNKEVSKEGKEAAQFILDELANLGLTKRRIQDTYYPDKATDDKDYKESIYEDGSKADYYSVIRNSKKNGFPGIIVEHAFVTNEDDAAKLKQESFLKKLGEADAQGIIKCYHLKMDYSAVYDFNYYKTRYEYIEENYGNNPDGAFNYFMAQGMSKGDQASAEFNVVAYRNRYQDLRAAFGNDYVRYYEHYINYGKSEGRNGREDDQNPSTKPNVDADAIFDGVNYADVYDFDYYIEHYPDLKAAFGNDRIRALEHFVVCGMSEGRQARGTFNVASYKNRYVDLQKAFGSALKSYYLHYIECGKKEGRIATDDGSSEPGSQKEGVTKYRGIEFKPIYNFNYYIEKYPDIKLAYGKDPEKALEHFVRHGMKEGRSGNADFNVHAYKSNYSDLRAAFGNDLEEYYIHYLTYGIKEGRDCALVAVTTYRGVDYSAVYNFEYYIERYPDLKAVFENDPVGALEHFLTYGIKEGRQASEKFNLVAYKNNYNDLRHAFGDNNKAYVEHYIAYGATEGRDAQNFKYHLIMASDPGAPAGESLSGTTLDQMVKYFLANSSYPTYYANNTDVRTIGDFCRIYQEECEAEGVNVAVAFCQAMKETKFLKFTGDVKVVQFNFAGLGATGNGATGLSFPDIRTGIRAQVQHLKAYASKSTELKNVCVDPRFGYVQRGSAPYVEWLGIQENPIPGCGWAAEAGYGTSIVNDYINVLSTY